MLTAAPFEGPLHAPYAEAWLNALYNHLFCDRPQDLKAEPGDPPTDWQLALCGPVPDLRAAARIAADHEAEARVRLMACHVLRAHGQPVPGRVLLGVVVEVPIDGGLDTLAAYVDGSVRYFHHSGHLEIVEAPEVTMPLVHHLAEAALAVVSRIGPWDRPRLPAPQAGRVRLSFLVSDGLYFGEGELPVIVRDALAGAVFERATELMQTVIGLARRRAA